ncbi:divalent-cation tolerance protein CutA [Cognatiyoonia sp. IB215446]|uniref:divalent-cation tolerance protein CutA n=1 Tax=Cognatiyoonia sp. IB215446 TaxID=3097355 RepID=UPI002A0B286B|nr:divalent-cation tolerance protein CutA [Cognatiyoonia sp. IB215446]MDX8348993.1 divalent-cation tolerance protein CutA [Cognatiyoonia sp. IB215446]
MAEIIEITITYHEADVARDAARDLVTRRLAACVHIAGPVESVFRWDDAIQIEPEWRLTVKTQRPLAQDVADHLIESHPYDLPGLVFHPCDCQPAFAAWVAAETATPDLTKTAKDI